MTKQDNLVELTRIYDQVEADLLAAFLEDDGLEFQMRRSARTMAPALPTAETPTIFMVFSEDEERAKDLLNEYREAQKADSSPNDEESD